MSKLKDMPKLKPYDMKRKPERKAAAAKAPEKAATLVAQLKAAKREKLK